MVLSQVDNPHQRSHREAQQPHPPILLRLKIGICRNPPGELQVAEVLRISLHHRKEVHRVCSAWHHHKLRCEGCCGLLVAFTPWIAAKVASSAESMSSDFASPFPDPVPIEEIGC